MKEITKDQKRRRRTVLYVLLLTALLLLLAAATYAWFSLSHTPRVSDMHMSVSSAAGLKLAPKRDAPDDVWSEVLDFSGLVGSETELKPATWSVSRGALVTCDYGIDGRLLGDDRVTLLSDSENANRSGANAYYVKGTFFAKSDSPVSVSLGDAVEVNDGRGAAGTYVIGTPLWNQTELRHDDGGLGAETAIRIGLRITKVNPVSGDAIVDSVFYIYEPNYDSHIGSDRTDDIPTPSIDGGATLIDDAHLIRQTTSSWSEADPVESGVTVKTLGRFSSETELFSLELGEIAAIDLYVWLEGQDADCTNLIDDARIIANMHFSADYTSHGGLVNIPD